MNFSERPIAMTDLETSGDIFAEHEILEIGLVLFDQKTLAILDTLNIKVRPEHIENALPEALKANTYTPEGWVDAVPLADALAQYSAKVQGAIFAAYNVSFDWGFINEGFRKTGLPNPMNTRENHDRLDVLTLAWAKGLREESSWNLRSACKHFGVPPEGDPHTALAGATTAYEVYKKLI